MIDYLELGCIRTDGGTQSRAAIDPATVEAYAEAYREGARLPPLVVFFDGSSYWLADGFHRLAAARAAELEDVDVDVRQGTRRDAVLYACGANADHGLRRTRADKRRAVETLLRDPEWSTWSDRAIAEAARVSADLVGDMRRELASVRDQVSESTPATRTGRDGKAYPAARVAPAAPSIPDTHPIEQPDPVPDCEACGGSGQVVYDADGDDVVDDCHCRRKEHDPSPAEVVEAPSEGTDGAPGDGAGEAPVGGSVPVTDDELDAPDGAVLDFDDGVTREPADVAHEPADATNVEVEERDVESETGAPAASRPPTTSRRWSEPDPAAPLVDLRCASNLDIEWPVADLAIVDPPWDYVQAIGATRADNHYETLRVSEIVPQLARLRAARIAVWATWPTAAEFLRHWPQFTTGGAWFKSGFGSDGEPSAQGRDMDVGHYGQGYHWAGCSEPVLLYAAGGGYLDRTVALRNAWVERPGIHSEKPIRWMVQWIRRWVPEGGLVVDPYAGLGTVAQAVILAGGRRRYLGTEIDPDRHQRALERIADLLSEAA